MQVPKPTTRLAARVSALVLLLVALLPGTPWSQEPWEGWIGPPADGIYGLRFGMDRFTVDGLIRGKGLVALEARPGTLRYQGDILGQRAELVAEFSDDARGGMGGRLCRVRLRWNSLTGTPTKALGLLSELEGLLEARYGPPLLSEDAGPHDLENGLGLVGRLYHGVEMRSLLQLFAPRPRSYDLQLRMEYPPLVREEEG